MGTTVKKTITSDEVIHYFSNKVNIIYAKNITVYLGHLNIIYFSLFHCLKLTWPMFRFKKWIDQWLSGYGNGDKLTTKEVPSGFFGWWNSSVSFSAASLLYPFSKTHRTVHTKYWNLLNVSFKINTFKKPIYFYFKQRNILPKYLMSKIV